MKKDELNTNFIEIESGIFGDPHGKQKVLKRKRGIQKTALYKQSFSYLDKLPRNKDFMKNVLMLRERYNLPQNGHGKTLLIKNVGRNYLIYPIKGESMARFVADTITLTKLLGLNDSYTQVLQHYIAFNNFKTSQNPETLINPDPAIIIDLSSYAQERHLKKVSDLTDTHQIALLINPYMSERALVDYIKKVYKTSIKPLQNKYKKTKVTLGKNRDRKPLNTERDKFILKQYKKGVSPELITSEVNTKYKSNLSYTRVRTIIRDRNKNTS